MRIYRFHDPLDYSYARAGRRGTWTDLNQGICPACTASRVKRIPPLIIEWEPGSDTVGDFTWPGFDDEVVVSNRLRLAFEGRVGCEFRTIKMTQGKASVKPKRMTRRSKPQVWLPYQGPKLWELVVTANERLDLPRSNWRLEKVCGHCGREFWAVDGPVMRAVVSKESWSGSHIFRFEQQNGGGAIYCTETIKSLAERERFTNVSFIESGRIA